MLSHKESLILSFKVFLMVMVFMPFWIFPLILVVGVNGARAEELNYSWFQIGYAAIPAIYAYYSMLKNLVKIQIYKIKGKLKFESI